LNFALLRDWVDLTNNIVFSCVQIPLHLSRWNHGRLVATIATSAMKTAIQGKDNDESSTLLIATPKSMKDTPAVVHSGVVTHRR